MRACIGHHVAQQLCDGQQLYSNVKKLTKTVVRLFHFTALNSSVAQPHIVNKYNVLLNTASVFKLGYFRYGRL